MRMRATAGTKPGQLSQARRTARSIADKGNTDRLGGKVAVVTGAGGGIGRSICLHYAAAGAVVLCADVNVNTAKQTAGEVKARGGTAAAVECDVSDSAVAKAAVETAMRRFGALHILVNNAAFFVPDATLPELDEALFARSFAVNVTGPFLMSRWAIPHIARSGGGSIIHIASQMGHVARRLQATYCATKSALLLLAKGMALDHAPDGIRVNTLSPGGIATQGMADQWGDMETAEREWGARMHPLGRLGRVDEIARAAVFLASEESSFVTGTDLLVDGGYTAL
jgi:NAD(P)-dependent dehydrogenase (short-subunit alcohol dehydrogenase family)